MKRFTHLKHLAHLLFVCALWTSALGQTTNPPKDEPYEEDPPCCDGVIITVGEPCADNKSINWSIDCGRTSFGNQGSFLKMSRGGAQAGSTGGRTVGFEQVMARSFGAGAKHNFRLRIHQPVISSALYNPSVIQYTKGSAAEVILNGSTIRQVLTDNAFTDIVALPGGNGFSITNWVRNGITLVKSGNFYNRPDEALAVTKITFENPDATPQRRLFMTSSQWNGSTRRDTSALYTEVGGAKPTSLTIASYEGLVVNPAKVIKVERLNYFYTANADYNPPSPMRVWDYQLRRTTWEAPTLGGVMQYLSLGGSGVPADNTISRKTLEEYRDFSLTPAGGETMGVRKVRHIEGYDTNQPLETEWEYYSSTNPLVNGRIKSVEYPEGNWEYYVYSDSPSSSYATKNKYSSWNDVSMANRSQARREYTYYNANYTTTRTYLAGQLVSRTNRYLSYPNSNEVQIITQVYDGSAYQTTTAINYSSDYGAGSAPSAIAGRPKSIEHPDGTFERWTYALLSGNKLRITHDQGSGSISNVTDGTRTIGVLTSEEVVISEEVKDIATGLEFSSWAATSDGSGQPILNVKGLPVRMVYNGNSDDYSEVIYSCCGSESRRNRNGIQIFYERDALDRIWQIKTDRGGAIPIIVDTTDYEFGTLSGQQTIVRTINRAVEGNSAAGVLRMSRIVAHLNGRRLESYAPDADGSAPLLGEKTSYAYMQAANSGLTTTITLPDGAVGTWETYLSGDAKAVYGSASTPMAYRYSALGSSGYRNRVTRSYRLTSRDGALIGAPSTWSATIPSEEWTERVTDPAGRVKSQRVAQGSNGIDLVTYSYHSASASAGQKFKLQSAIDADGAETSYEYDQRARLSKTIEAMPGSTGDRETTYIYTKDNDPELGPSHVVETSLLDAVTNTLVTVSREVSAGDSYGKKKAVVNTAHSFCEQSLPINGNWYKMKIQPDTSLVVCYYEGARLLAQTYWEASSSPPTTAPADIQNVTTTGFIFGMRYTYDAFDRLETVTDSRQGTTTYSNYLVNGAIGKVEDPGGRETLFVYDKRGQRTQVDAPDTNDHLGNNLTNVSYTSYDFSSTVKAM